MTMTIEAAMTLVQSYLDEKSLSAEDNLVILKDKVVEKEYGWIFIFNSKRFIETGNILYSLGGNGPIVVEKESGKFHELGSAKDFEDTIKEFEEDMGFSST